MSAFTVAERRVVHQGSGRALPQSARLDAQLPRPASKNPPRKWQWISSTDPHTDTRRKCTEAPRPRIVDGQKGRRSARYNPRIRQSPVRWPTLAQPMTRGKPSAIRAVMWASRSSKGVRNRRDAHRRPLTPEPGPIRHHRRNPGIIQEGLSHRREVPLFDDDIYVSTARASGLRTIPRLQPRAQDGCRTS